MKSSEWYDTGAMYAYGIANLNRGIMRLYWLLRARYYRVIADALVAIGK